MGGHRGSRRRGGRSEILLRQVDQTLQLFLEVQVLDVGRIPLQRYFDLQESTSYLVSWCAIDSGKAEDDCIPRTVDTT